MALNSLVEAAIKFGFSVQLVAKLTEKCPKRGENRTLQTIVVGGVPYLDDREIEDYRRYLSEPWPTGKDGRRPYLPALIADDVKAECHFQCAICGAMDNGEVAHIDPVSGTLNNSPDNLILLCPNHHTKYDYGYQPASNVTREAVSAAKLVKREARRRMLRFEANTVAALSAMLNLLKAVERKAEKAEDPSLRAVYATEIRALVASVPDLSRAAQDAASRDQPLSDADAIIVERAPKLAALAAAVSSRGATESRVREAGRRITEVVSDLVIDLDEVECPRCGGAGQIGLRGRLCSYCKGDCVVSRAAAEAYDPEDLDEVECPRCGGSGEIGLRGMACRVCGGDTVLSRAQAEAYDPEDLDEVDCPRCAGKGEIGLRGRLCSYCKGDCVVSSADAEAYNPDELDEVECPRCGGSGEIGFGGTACRLCKGDCVVRRALARAFRDRL